MNIEQANAISMPFFLNKIGFDPVKENEFSALYKSPIRNEKTASFRISKRKNRWYDFGTGKGGDLVNFVIQLLKHCKQEHTTQDALRYITIMAGAAPRIQKIDASEVNVERGLIFKSARALEHKALLHYLSDRGIDLQIAMQVLETVKVQNPATFKTITSLGFKSDEGGYELRNRRFKGCVGPKYITFINGSDRETKGVHIFEGFMDYLTILTIKGVFRLNEDVIVLNSLSCLDKATPYINEYRHKVVYSWMDNDLSGREATVNISKYTTKIGLRHRSMNSVYLKSKDVNAWHMHNLNLKL